MAQTTAEGVTIATILRDLAESRASISSCWPAPAASTAAITIPHPQKTGLALVRLRRIPARRPRARVRRERDALPREPRRRDARTASCSGSSPRAAVHPGHRRLRRRRRRCWPKPTARDVPLMRTRAATPLAMARLSRAARRLPGGARRRPWRADGHPRARRPVVGESGIGKSECALDLVVRGHRLVADDAVELRCRARIVPDRHLPGADPAPHGDPRASA